MNEEKFYSFMGIIRKSGKLVSGYNSCITEIKKDKCKLIVISEDASSNTKEKFISMCNSKNIPYILWGEKERFGLSIGKPPSSVLGVKDENMSKVVLSMLE